MQILEKGLVWLDELRSRMPNLLPILLIRHLWQTCPTFSLCLSVTNQPGFFLRARGKTWCPELLYPPPCPLCMLTLLQVRHLTVNQLLKGGHGLHGSLKTKSKSKVAKLEGAPFKRGICLRVSVRVCVYMCVRVFVCACVCMCARL